MGLRAIDRPVECARFALAYLVERDPLQAYLRIHPRARLGTACVEGRRLLARPEVQERLAAASQGRPLSEIIGKLPEQARGPVACRYCHGEGHGYHRTAQELQNDLQAHQEAERERRDLFARVGKVAAPRPFDRRGGVGFDPRRGPHPACPNCFGRGDSSPAGAMEAAGAGEGAADRSSAP